MDATLRNGLSLAQLQTGLGKQDEISRLGRTVSAHDRAEIRKVSEEFESVFLELVLKSMRDTVPKSGLINGGNGEDIYRSMLDQEYAKSMSHQNMTGIGEAIERYLLGVASHQGGKPHNHGEMPHQGAAAAKPLADAGDTLARDGKALGLQSDEKQGTIGSSPHTPFSKSDAALIFSASATGHPRDQSR